MTRPEYVANTLIKRCSELRLYSGDLEATPGIEPGYTALQAVA